MVPALVVGCVAAGRCLPVDKGIEAVYEQQRPERGEDVHLVVRVWVMVRVRIRARLGLGLG